MLLPQKTTEPVVTPEEATTEPNHTAEIRFSKTGIYHL